MRTWADVGIVIPAGAVGEIDVLCPQCSPTRKKANERCLSVNIEKGTWQCHHCPWKGGLGSASATERHGKPPPRVLPPITTPPVLTPAAREWLTARGLDPEVCLRFGVRSVGASLGSGKPFVSGEVLAFPYFREGVFVNAKYRALDTKRFHMEKDAERIWYGLEQVDPQCVVVVEGECDKLAVAMAGIDSCVSVPDGAPAPDAKAYATKFEFFDTDGGVVSGAVKIVLAVDADTPGLRLAEELARRFGRERCWRVQWPDGCKDANDVLRAHGADVLRQCLDDATPCPIEGAYTITDLFDEAWDLIENGPEYGVSTGWPAIDRHYTVLPGQVTVVTGMPSAGKSLFLDALLVNLAREHGWTCALYSPENVPLKKHMVRYSGLYCDVPTVRGPTAMITAAQFVEAAAWIAEHFTWLHPPELAVGTLPWMLERARELVFRRGIQGLVIDPWNQLESERPVGMTETEYIGRSLRTVRHFARAHGVHVWIVVHPAKLYRDKEGHYPVPTLYDCAGSAHWFNMTDNGLCLHRPTRLGPRSAQAELHVQKIRFSEIGALGVVSLEYDPVVRTYREWTGNGHDPEPPTEVVWSRPRGDA